MPSCAIRRAPLLAALVLALLVPARDSEATILGPRLKELQKLLLKERAESRESAREELRARREPNPKPARVRRTTARKGPAAKGGAALKRTKEPMPSPEATIPTAAATRLASPMRANAFAPNVRVNDPTTDSPPGAGELKAGQSEVAVAAHGSNVLIAYNDGQGFISSSSYSHLQGYSYSTDGGKTFKDGTFPPVLAGWTWISDPVVTVNEKNGDFWFCALVDVPSLSQNGIGLVRGFFSGDTLLWDVPKPVRLVSNFNTFIDKPWMVVDSTTGRLYVSYTAFGFSGDTIDVQSSPDGGTTWTNFRTLSALADVGFVQGSRVQVGPAGQVYATWYVIGQNDPYADFFRFRASFDGGFSWSSEKQVASLYSNFSSGAPGFNRERGITFPSMAVDRTHGVHQNRIYVTWNEGLDIFHDNINPIHGIVENESNNTPATANTFTVGDTIHGLCTVNDFDYFKFTANAGQTAVFFVGNLDPSLDASMRIFCSDGVTQLAYSEPGAGLNNLIQFTFPASGVYYLRMRPFNSTGQYMIYSFFHQPQAGDRARDHRDVFATFSDDSGKTWHSPVRVNDEVAGFDDWLPEVAVSGQGKPYVIWYDWRDAPASTCGGQSQVYLSRSDDGGNSWLTLGSVTDASSKWSQSQSNIAPNQGDYLGIFANDLAVFPVWGDARDSSVDVWTVHLPLASTPTQLALASVAADPSRVSLAWYGTGSAALTATVYRRTQDLPWNAIGNAVASGSDLLRYDDRTVSAGARYAYRIGVHDLEGVTYSEEVWVDVPLAPRLAIQGVRPNPTSRDMWVTYSLADDQVASLELLDVAGRRVLERRIEPRPGAFSLNLSEGVNLPPGIYLVKLTQGARFETARVTVLR